MLTVKRLPITCPINSTRLAETPYSPVGHTRNTFYPLPLHPLQSNPCLTWRRTRLGKQLLKTPIHLIRRAALK
jgi:hypothetical protein